MLRIGIVGCGEVTQIIHLPTLAGLREEFRVTSLCDVSPRVLDGVGAEWGIAARCTDYRDLIVRPDVDAVLVANPHVFHAEVAIAAMRAGKHVLIEKPMCMSLEEADALASAQRETGRIAQIGYMRRYAPAFTEAAARIRALGEIKLARIHDVIGRNALIIGQIAKVIRGTDLPSSANAELARRTAESIASAIGPAPVHLQNAYALLLGLSSHDLSAMRELLGYPKRVLFAATRGREGRSLTAAFDYGGYTALFTTAVDLIPRFDSHIEVFGTTETVRVDYDTPYVRNLPIRMTVTSANAIGGAETRTDFAWRDPFAIEWLAFRDNLLANRAPKTSIADARQDLTLFRDMIEAMRAADFGAHAGN